MRHIGKVSAIKRSYDGELQVDIDLKTGGYVVKLPNTLSNFAMDEEVVVVAIRRSDADRYWNALSTAAELAERDEFADAESIWQLTEAFRPEGERSKAEWEREVAEVKAAMV